MAVIAEDHGPTYDEAERADVPDPEPRDVDRALWMLAQAEAKARQAEATAVRSVYHAAGAREVAARRGRGRGKFTYWTLDGERVTLGAALDRAKLVATGAGYYEPRQAAAALERYSAAVTEIEQLHEQAKPLNAEWERRRWSRFFLVTSSDGHIHSSMECSTCHPTTAYAWLPDVSGKTEAEAVAEHGPLLCSVCFPTAPVEWTVGAAAVKTATDCPGSRTYDFDTATARMGYYTGNYGVCSHCGQRITLTSANRLRGHKPQPAETGATA